MKKITSLVIVLTMVFTAFAIFTTGSSAAELTTDGLVSSFEGSSYEGTTWTDLVGENDITDCVGKFENGAYVVGLGQQQMLPQALYEALGGEEYTFELNLGSFSGGEGIQYYGWLCNNNGTTAEKFALFITVSEKALYIKTAGRPKTYRPKLAAETTEALVEQLQDATISVTYKSGDKVKLYVNGVLVDEKDAPATNANTGSKFQLGNSDAKKTTNSEYQAMRFYNKALTAEQIAANYAYDNAPKVSSTESVVIYNPDKGVAMTANKVEDREKLVGVEATANKDGTLTVADDSYVVLTKTNYDNSTFTLTANGKYLTSGATGNSLSFTDEATE